MIFPFTATLASAAGTHFVAAVCGVAHFSFTAYVGFPFTATHTSAAGTPCVAAGRWSRAVAKKEGVAQWRYYCPLRRTRFPFTAVLFAAGTRRVAAD